MNDGPDASASVGSDESSAIDAEPTLTSGETAASIDTNAGSPTSSGTEAATSNASAASSFTTDNTEPNDGGADTGETEGAAPPTPRLPPENGGLDYQLGGGYAPPEGVTIVSRDRTDDPALGLYNICYVNGFQVQPGEESDWDSDLLLRDEQGDVIIDEDWNEVMLDVSTPEKRERIAEVVGGWVRRCAVDGFDAVEIDNLDTFTRSGGRITDDDAVAFMADLSAVAHEVGVAIAQKNSAELVSRRDEMGTDFVVSEECNTWSECDVYIEEYGRHVLMIEYTSNDFQTGCAQYGSEFSVVLRDLELTLPDDARYVFDGC
jgi:hypothetical protein